MHTGTVKWFNNAKGYGFILSDQVGGDIFAHFSCIEMDGYKTLKAGQAVQFETEQGAKGLHATKIQALKTTQQADSSDTSRKEEKEFALEH